MTDLDDNRLETLVKQAESAQDDSITALTELVTDIESVPDAEKDIDSTVRMIQLSMEYRLDTQSALARLFQINNSLFQILGIEPQASLRINLERMNFALGSEDLQQMLYSLSLLVNSLSLIASRYKKSFDQTCKQKQEAESQVSVQLVRIYEKLQKAVTDQKRFIASISEIDAYLQTIQEVEVGPRFDHIAALRGPISQFFQAEQNGLEMSYNLYEKIHESSKLNHPVSTVLEEANLVLHELSQASQPHQLFTPKTEHQDKPDDKSTTKHLEQFFPVT